jgi:glycosyltransferase involved in cell wall biosynthesis
LADALLLVLQDEPMRRRLGENAQALSRARYTWDHTVAKIEEICLYHIDKKRQG